MRASNRHDDEFQERRAGTRDDLFLWRPGRTPWAGSRPREVEWRELGEFSPAALAAESLAAGAGIRPLGIPARGFPRACRGRGPFVRRAWLPHGPRVGGPAPTS